MRRAPLPYLAAALGLAAALSGCGSTSEPPADPGPTTASATSSTTSASSPGATMTSPAVSPPAPGKRVSVTVIGSIEEGVEQGCLVLTDEETGTVYSVTQDELPEIGPGTRVKVEGHIDPGMVSYCQQGEVIIVDEVTDPDAG